VCRVWHASRPSRSCSLFHAAPPPESSPLPLHDALPICPAPPGSMVQLGRADGTRQSFNSPSALSATPTTVGTRGTKLGTNHQGTSAPPDSFAVELPEEITSMLGVPRGLKRVGPILPAPVATF